MRLTEDNRVLVSVPQDDSLVLFHLPADFPEQAPDLYLSRDSAPLAAVALTDVCGCQWQSTMLLVDVYTALKQNCADRRPILTDIPLGESVGQEREHIEIEEGNLL